jgi:hypothetical protein
MIETIITSAIVAILTTITTIIIQENYLNVLFRTEFMAENVARKLLESPQWEKRSFEEIKKRLNGFEENELRKILVRAGAVCFRGENEQEFWGLISRNEEKV